MATTNTTPPRKRGRPPTGKGIAVQLRLPKDLIAAVDRECERLQRERPGSGAVSRAQTIREVLGRALLTKASR